MQNLHQLQIDPIISRALEEDWGSGDWTTDLCVPAAAIAEAILITREDIVLAGIDVAQAVFKKVDPSLELSEESFNGDLCAPGSTLMTIKGHARSILKAERVALNLLARLSGIATLTRHYVMALEGSKTQLLDTRKTTPGLRLLEKTAAVIGGAKNHRFGLCDGVIVRENHARAAGGIKICIERLLESLPPTLKIEVEATQLEEVKEAVEAGAEIILFDNMGIEDMRRAVQWVNGRARLEASGNVSLENVRAIADTGVDFISTSATIQSARSADLSLLFNPFT